MRGRKPRVPSYRLHKPSGRAVVTLDGRDYYLGEYGTPEAEAEYQRLTGLWLIHGGQVPQRQASPTVNQLILGYWEEAQKEYRRDGEPTTELESMRLAIRYLRAPYGRTLAKDFGPLDLKACRQAMIDKDLSRGVCNGYTKRIVRVFRWGVENELVPSSVLHGLQAVRGLRKGRSPARETEPVRPAPELHVEAALAFVSSQVQTMARLQLLTGMRPGEVVQMRWCDIDRSEEPWVYRPARHKTDYRNHERVVPLGPRARRLLEPYLGRPEEEPLFSPREAERERSEARRAARKTPLTPSQRRRGAKGNRRRAPKNAYTTASYRRAIARACEKAKVPRWHPHQLRHNAATRIRREFGIEVARQVLGQKSIAVAELYAERDQAVACRVMAKVG